MHQVQLKDELYREADRRALAAGFGSVDEFVAERLESDFLNEQEDFDDRFTPEVVARLDRISDEMKAGKFYTAEQAGAELAKRRAEWLRKNPR